MATDRKKLETNERYLQKLERVTLRVYKDGSSGFTASDLQEAAAAANQSVNAYIIQAIQERIARDSKTD